MSDKNSYESVKDDLDKIVSIIFWIILGVILLFVLPSWFTGGLWQVVCAIFGVLGRVCDAVGPYIPVLTVVWLVAIVVMIVWGLWCRTRG